MTDSSTGDMIIKLVNLLPVEVSTTVDIKDCASYAGQATCTVLSGTPDDRNAVPAESSISMAPQFDYTMPPYSFTTIRAKKAEKK